MAFHPSTRALACGLVLLLGCGSSHDLSSPTDASTSPDADAVADATQRESVRGERYCEVLVVTNDGTRLHVDVYNTEGLNDCPEAEWEALDADAIREQTGAARVVLNGPRYWTIDSFAGSMLIDDAEYDFGGIAMRLAGQIELTLAQAATLMNPYVPRTINRNSSFTWYGGLSVNELVDDAGHVYTMQSFSVQKEEQSLDSLAALGERLALADGFRFRTRTLEEDLTVTSMGMATVIQDELGNTYLRSE